MARFSKHITIKDVAKNANVSVSTVSRYLNQSGYVDFETAQRIAKAIDETRYSPNIVARGLKTRKSHVVLLVVPDICNPFYSTMAKSTQFILSEQGYVMALFDSNESMNEMSAVSIAQQMFASGILFGSIDIKQKVIDALLNSSIPIVGINAYQQYPFDTVHVAGSTGSYLATEHLINLGHQRIGFAGGTPNTMIGASRREGYSNALKAANLPVNDKYVVELGFSQADGYCAGNYLIQQSPLPTAICCANDQIAFGVLNALNDHNILVPHQISVTGMDDVPYALISNPSLTTVTNDATAFSREGIRLLFDRINNKYALGPRSVSISHQLVIRNSTSSPK